MWCTVQGAVANVQGAVANDEQGAVANDEQGAVAEHCSRSGSGTLFKER